MLQESERKELFDKLNEHKKRISELRDSLNEANSQKESWFEKNSNIGKEISKQIHEIRQLRSTRDKLSNEVRELKKERQNYNGIVTSKIKQIKEINSKKENVSKKFNFKGDPSRIKEDIAHLETKIETEVISFEAEKKIMQKIKELKKKYDEFKKISKVWGEGRELSKEIDDSKDQAEEIHKKIQNKAAESQNSHEKMIGLSKEVDELKKKEKEAFGKFAEYKQRFSELNNQLKYELLKLKDIKEKLDIDKKERINIIHEGEERTLKAKEEEVHEKIKNKKKLTTEDLLIFQRLSKD